MRSETTPEDHARMLAQVAESIPEIEREREDLRGKLDRALDVVSPLECLALASALYLIKDPDTYSEAEDDRSPAHLDFLALSALPLLEDASSATEVPPGSSPTHNGPDADELADVDEAQADRSYRYWRAAALIKATNEAIAVTRELFSQSTDLTWRRFVVKANEPGVDLGFEEFRREAQLQSMNIRGVAYPEHLSLVLDGLLGEFDQDCREHLGFTASEAWSCATAVGSLMTRRVQVQRMEMHKDFEAALERVRHLRKKKQLPKHLAALTPTQQQDWLRHRLQCEHFAEPLAMLTLTPAELSAEAAELAEEEGDEPVTALEGNFARAVAVSEVAASAWLESLTCSPSEFVPRFHRQPVGGHPITRKPILAVEGGGYLVPSPTTLVEVLRPAMEDGLRAASSEVWDRYDRHRAVWVERTAADRLGAALPGSVSWTGIEWASPGDQSDLDGLVHCDDFAARLQCKAGRVSTPARRGAPSMAEDIQEVINDAAHQHARLAKALTSHNPEALGFTSDQVEALSSSLSIEAIVCLDDVTVWSTETHKLRHLVNVPDTLQLPWVLSLTDLFAVTDVLQGPELVHYVMRRLRVEGEGRISAHDELDWLGNYINDGLFFDEVFARDEAPDNLRLLSFTGQFDTWYFSRAGMTSRQIPRPQQAMPSELRQLIGRLSRDRPRHWLTAGLLLLNGGSEVRENIVELMEHTRERAAAVGWSTGTQVYPDYSLSLTVNRRSADADLVAAMRQYWEDNIRSQGRPNAVSIGLGANGRLVVDVVETDPSRTIGHVLMSRAVPAARVPVSTVDASDDDDAD